MKQRITSAAAAAAVFAASFVPCFAKSGTIRIEGGAVTGIPVTVSGADGGRWQLSSDGTDFADAALNAYVDSDTQYTIKPKDAGLMLRYVLADESETSNVIGPLPESAGPLGVTSKTDDLIENTNPDYCFKMSGSEIEFIMLDSDDTDGVFVLAKDYFGKEKWNAKDSAENVKFDPEQSGSLAYRLNSELADGKWKDGAGVEYALPGKMAEYIKMHAWFTEAANESTNAPADYVVNAKIALLSHTEWLKYKGVVGYGDNASENNWLLRTARGDSAKLATRIASVCTQKQSAANQGRVIQANMDKEYNIRPCFWLEKNYFAENVLDIGTAGSVVKKFIAGNFTANELRNNGYSLADLVELGFEMGDIPQASDVSVTYTGEQGVPITAQYTLSGGADDSKTEVRWYSAASANGTYTLVQKNVYSDKGNKYFVKPADKGKYFKCEVIPKNSEGSAGMGTMSENSAGPAISSVGPKSVVLTPAPITNQNTPAEYSFSIYGEDKEYILLDSENMDTDGIFLFTKNHYGRKKWADENSSNYVRFDPEEVGSFAYKLNNDFLESGWTADYGTSSYTFSAKMKKQLLEHEWFTESGHGESAAAGDYRVTCKLAPLSLAEVLKYADRIGNSDDCSDNQWYLRTARGDQKNLNNQMLTVITRYGSENQGKIIGVNLTYGSDVRFGFYVGADFFKKVKIDPSSAGGEVLKLLYKTCELSDLQALGYTEEEISTLGYNKLPKAENVGFTGTLAAGEKLGVDFDYTGELPKADEAICEWFVSDSPDGEFTCIGTGMSIVLPEDLGGKYVKVVLKPVQENGLIGDAVSTVSQIPLAAASDYSVWADDISVNDNVVTASFSAQNRNGDNPVLLTLFGYDADGKLIFTSAETWNVTDEGKSISKTVPQEVKEIRASCLSNDGLLRPICMSVYGEEQK